MHFPAKKIRKSQKDKEEINMLDFTNQRKSRTETIENRSRFLWN